VAGDITTQPKLGRRPMPMSILSIFPMSMGMNHSFIKLVKNVSYLADLG
jgi:hypothetical protein